MKHELRHMLRLSNSVYGGLLVVVVCSMLGSSRPATAGVVMSQLPDASVWPGNPVHTTTLGQNLQTVFNIEVTIGPNGAATHTFTPTTSFQLDKFIIRAAGAPTTGLLYLVENPVGGTEADGFVNLGSEAVPFGPRLISALPFTFNGTATRTLLEFDLTGSDQVMLNAGTKYAIDLRNTGTGTMYWLRDINPYSGGNIYARNPVNPGAPGERFDVAGGRRDGALALYAVPEPASLLLVAAALLAASGQTRRGKRCA
jgi:hypothetical protein